MLPPGKVRAEIGVDHSGVADNPLIELLLIAINDTVCYCILIVDLVTNSARQVKCF